MTLIIIDYNNQLLLLLLSIIIIIIIKFEIMLQNIILNNKGNN